MKRRAFLRMLGLAPVVAASTSLALPKPDRPDEMVREGSVGELGPELIAPVPDRIGSIRFSSIQSRKGAWRFDTGTGELRITT